MSYTRTGFTYPLGATASADWLAGQYTSAAGTLAAATLWPSVQSFVLVTMGMNGANPKTQLFTDADSLATAYDEASQNQQLAYGAMFDSNVTTDGPKDEFVHLGVAQSVSVLESFKSPWVIAGVGLLIAAAIWHRSQKKRTAKRARRTSKVKAVRYVPSHQRTTLRLRAARAR
jgi:hypothetical protein